MRKLWASEMKELAQACTLGRQASVLLTRSVLLTSTSAQLYSDEAHAAQQAPGGTWGGGQRQRAAPTLQAAIP